MKKSIVFPLIALLFACQSKDLQPHYGVFAIIHHLTLPGIQEVIDDAMTGGISERWDQHGMDSTMLRVEVRALGERGKGISEIVSDVWHHFHFERLKSHIAKGYHQEKSPS